MALHVKSSQFRFFWLFVKVNLVFSTQVGLFGQLNNFSRTCAELLECGATNNDIEFVNKFRARLCFNQANMCGQVFCWMLNIMKYDMIKMFYTSLREVCRAWWRLLQNCCKLKWTIIPWYIMIPSNPDLNRSYFCEFSSYFHSSKVWIKHTNIPEIRSTYQTHSQHTRYEVNIPDIRSTYQK